MILAVLQARVSSTRLPGKVMKPLLGTPMLLRQIERVRRSRRIDRLIVATSTDRSDDGLADLCRGARISCFRGSLDDVLDRFYQAARAHDPEHVVRLTGDCPLADPAVIDATISHHIQGGYDYTSNSLVPTFPDGLDAEVTRFSALREAWEQAKLPSQREHVTPFLYQHPERYRLGSFTREPDLSHLRWTVDEPDDFRMVEAIYNALHPADPAFATDEILRLLAERPELSRMNGGIVRNAGYAKSLAKDGSADTPSRADGQSPR